MAAIIWVQPYEVTRCIFITGGQLTFLGTEQSVWNRCQHKTNTFNCYWFNEGYRYTGVINQRYTNTI